MSTRPRVRAVTPLFIVADLQRSIDFYCNKLGFVDPNVHGEPPCFAMMNRDGFDLMLSLAEQPAHVRPNGTHQVWDVYISVADIAAEIAALKAADVRIERGPTDAFYNMREIDVVDPDGHRICLAQDISNEPLSFAEVWSGVLEVGPAKLRLVVKLAPSQGRLVGRLDSLDQNASNVPIDQVIQDGSTLRFEIKSIDATYTGTFNESKTELSGQWFSARTILATRVPQGIGATGGTVSTRRLVDFILGAVIGAAVAWAICSGVETAQSTFTSTSTLTPSERPASSGVADLTADPNPAVTTRPDRVKTDSALVSSGVLTTAAPANAHMRKSRGLVIEGNLVDSSGNRIEVGVVRAMNEHGQYYEYKVQEGEDYFIDDLSPGTLDLLAESKGYMPAHSTITLAPSEVRRRVDFVIDRQIELPVRFVTKDGVALRDVYFIMADTGGGASASELVLAVASTSLELPDLAPSETASGFASPAGEYKTRSAAADQSVSLAESWDGLLCLNRPLPLVAHVVQFVNGSPRWIVATQPIEPGANEVLVVLDATIDQAASAESQRCALHMRFVDSETRKPVRGTRVVISNAQSFKVEGIADADGTVDFTNCPGTMLDIQADAPGFETYFDRWDGRGGGTRGLGYNQALFKKGTKFRIAGVVVDESGQPILRDIHVHWQGTYTQDPNEYDVVLHPDASGRFALSTDRHFRAAMRIDAFGGYGSTVADIDSEDDSCQDLKIVVRRGIEVLFRPKITGGSVYTFRILMNDAKILERSVAGGIPFSVILSPQKYSVALATHEQAEWREIDVSSTSREFEIKPP